MNIYQLKFQPRTYRRRPKGTWKGLELVQVEPPRKPPAIATASMDGRKDALEAHLEAFEDEHADELEKSDCIVQAMKTRDKEDDA